MAASSCTSDATFAAANRGRSANAESLPAVASWPRRRVIHRAFAGSCKCCLTLHSSGRLTAPPNSNVRLHEQHRSTRCRRCWLDVRAASPCSCAIRFGSPSEVLVPLHSRLHRLGARVGDHLCLVGLTGRTGSRQIPGRGAGLYGRLVFGLRPRGHSISLCHARREGRLDRHAQVHLPMFGVLDRLASRPGPVSHSVLRHR